MTRPARAVRCAGDRRSRERGLAARASKQAGVLQLINAVPRPRATSIANLDPLQRKRRRSMPPGARPGQPTASRSGTWSGAFVTGGSAVSATRLPLGEITAACCATPTAAPSAPSVHAQLQDTDEKHVDPGAGRGAPQELAQGGPALHPRASSARPRRSRRFLAHASTSASKRFSLEGAETPIPMLDDDPRRGGRRRHRRGGASGMAHRGRLNVLANIVGKSYDQIFREFEGNLDPDRRAGLGRREVPPRRRRASHAARPGSDIQRRAGRQPQPPGGGRPGGRGHGPGQAGPASTSRATYAGAAAADPRRRRLRRPGRGRRDAQPVRAARLPHRRHRSTSSSTTRSASPPRPTAARSSLYCHRRRQDDPGADLPRERRRPRGVRARGPAGASSSASAFKQGRRHRPGAATGATATTRPTTRRYTQPLMYELIESRRSVRKLYTEALVNRGDLVARGRRAGRSTHFRPAPPAGAFDEHPRRGGQPGRPRSSWSAGPDGHACRPSTPTVDRAALDQRCWPS